MGGWTGCVFGVYTTGITFGAGIGSGKAFAASFAFFAALLFFCLDLTWKINQRSKLYQQTDDASLTRCVLEASLHKVMQWLGKRASCIETGHRASKLASNTQTFRVKDGA